MTEAKTTKTQPRSKAVAPAKKSAPKAKTAPKETMKDDFKGFSVFATGGKQYRVSVGDKLKIEKLVPSTGGGQVTYKEGDRIIFDKVLLVDDGQDTSIGTPFIAGASISAILNKIGRYPKITVIKYKQKSRYFKKNGHRQPFFEVKIDSIK